jgi:hypothetical protein
METTIQRHPSFFRQMTTWQEAGLDRGEKIPGIPAAYKTDNFANGQ